MPQGMNTLEKPAEIISARGYAWLLGDPWLRQAVVPGGILSSPYEVLDYQSTLILRSPEGTQAMFARRQEIRFFQDGVAAILDHAWGDGVLLTDYMNDAGKLEGSFNDRGRQHLVVALRRRMARGETLGFRVRREARVGFTQNEEWLQTIVDHPIRRLCPSIVFPKERPCRQAVLQVGRRRLRLPVLRRARGQTMVRVAIDNPGANMPYTIHWSW